jgi:mannonate dehydratase
MMLLQSWRWYGPDDPVSLSDIKQAGASSVVTALHYIPHGEIWPKEDILRRKALIEQGGLRWDVVESVNVHESIKTRSGRYRDYLDNYRESLRNLAACGIRTVCYNFMPVLDWTRTQLDYVLPDGSKALRFDWTDLAAFDLFFLKREDAERDYDPEVRRQAEARFQAMNESQRARLAENVLMGVPGEGSVSLEALQTSIDTYRETGAEGLRDNLAYFLEAIMDTCEEVGIRMTVHPDDPPLSILGLPRVVSSLEDLKGMLQRVDRAPNGICFCTGSLGAGKHNDPVKILREVGERVYFVHLRNVHREKDPSFFEADHLGGDVDMYAVMRELVLLQQKRQEPIPFRPDHGHQMLDDLHKQSNPGYSAIGRLRGLAELRGLELGIFRGL